MTMIDILFYAVFISQIFLISYHYPKKTYDRNAFVLRTYPASEYPKLYKHSKYVNPEKALNKTMLIYMSFNIAIAVFGIGLLIAMVIHGYAPSNIKANQDLIFVLFFFVLQALPHNLLEISTHNWHKHMRNAAVTSKRAAELTPRRLFDFIAPAHIVFAVTAFIAWASFYLYNKGFTTPWDNQTYITFIGMTGMNLLYIILGYKFLRGKKPDPHQNQADQHRLIKTKIRVLLFASIAASVSLLTFGIINQNGWDIFEPIAMSLYFQIIIIFGIGEILRGFKIETINFDVYKEDPWLV